MPTPLGHALAGLAVHALTARDGADLHDTRRAALVCAMACAPDLDFALRLVDGRNHHQAESHSIGFAVIAALATAVVLRLAPPKGRTLGVARTSIACGVGWCSHVLLDWLGGDTHPPIGLLALWPLSRDYHKAGFTVFMDIGRTLDAATVRHDAVAMAWECALLVPAVLVIWRARSASG